VSVDLRTRYLGLDLRSPIVASSSPLTGADDTAKRVEDAGAEALDYFPNIGAFAGVGDRYLARLERIRAQSSIPVIASLNATTPGGWVRYARLMQDAGADALELNLYRLAADPRRTAGDMEAADLDLIAAVRGSVSIPLAVKLSPYYTALAAFTGRVAASGADGLVLFNRFYQPDLDLESLDVVARVDLSRPWELRLPMRWIAILRPQLPGGVSLAATSGVHGGTDVVKALMVGADVAMMTSSLLLHGPEHLRTVEDELVAWMAEHEYVSVAQMRGSANQAAVEDPSAFERANYMDTLHSWAAPQDPVPAA
jgi:dihydroorotate dehydrogenase (fumarate)